MQTGGMAEVFRARRLPDRRTVAVKRMLSNLSDSDHFWDMFHDEAKIATGLDHPNIVETLDIGVHDGLPFLVMENVDGVNLRELFTTCGEDRLRMPVGLVCSMVASVCDALSYGHNTPDGSGMPLRVVHRDVSPANILVSSEGQIKLIDFGVAKARDRIAKTSTGLLKGKISYLSPEQLGGTPADHQADVFAAGIVLWELLTCKRLFDAVTDFQTFELLRRCKVEPPSSINPLVPGPLDKIVARALAKKPRDRYQDAAELRDALASTTRSLGERWTPDRIAEWVRAAMGLATPTPRPTSARPPSMPPRRATPAIAARSATPRPPRVPSAPAQRPPSTPRRARPPNAGATVSGKPRRTKAPAPAPGPGNRPAVDGRGNPIELSTWGDSTGVIVPPPAGAPAAPKPTKGHKASRNAIPRPIASAATERVGASSSRVSALLLLLTLSLVTSAIAAPQLWLPLTVS